MNLFKSAVLCVAIAVLCGCDQGQPTPPVASNPKHVATNVEDVALRESGNSIGIKFKLILAGTFTMGEHDDAHEVTLATPFKMGVREVTQWIRTFEFNFVLLSPHVTCKQLQPSLQRIHSAFRTESIVL